VWSGATRTLCIYNEQAKEARLRRQERRGVVKYTYTDVSQI